MKKLAFIITATLIGITGNTQENESKVDLRVGIGKSLLGTGDMRTIMFENEVNIKLNNYFTWSGGLGYAQSTSGVFEQTSFVQLNTNIYISPFKNNRKNDFRIGTGMSWYAVSDVFRASSFSEDGLPVPPKFEISKRNAFGFNVIIENTYSITEKFLVGVKAFSQPYFNSDRNTGIMLKFGVKL